MQFSVVATPALGVLLMVSSAASAQTPRPARLAVTVLDPTGAVLPGATVTLGPAGAPAPGAVREAQTSAAGIAQFAALPPGEYEIRAEFPGFRAGLLPGVRLRTGNNSQRIVLQLDNVEDSVSVEQDADEAASDRRGTSFGSTLTREQIEALSDDPEELRRQLQEIAGPGAVIRVDSFEGAALPPKALIRSIRITRDAFAAENHNPGAFGIDILTQPGLGRLGGNAMTRIRSHALNSRNPFTPRKGDELTQDYALFLGGPIVAQRSGFTLFLQGVTAYDAANLNAALPGASRREALSNRTRRDRISVASSLDWAITLDQTLRVAYNPVFVSNSNLGIGAYDLPERAYGTEENTHNVRIQEVGPLGRRGFMNTRLGLSWLRRANTSAVEAPTIRVNDAFTSGGQQLAGAHRQVSGNLSSDLDYVRGIHSLRGGVSIDFGAYRTDATSNYLGTYTFASLADYDAGRAATFTQRIGDPLVTYGNLQTALYVQDDIRVRRNLTLSPGLRYEAQARLAGSGELGPRFGLTWSPFAGGRSTVRGSAGIFYDWLGTTTLEQTIRLDGTHQLEVQVLEPRFPDPGPLTAVAPTRYALADDLRMARHTRYSAGFDHAFLPKLRVGVLYAYTRGDALARGVSSGRAPGNVIAVVSDARSRQHAATASLSAGTPPPPPWGGAGGRRWDWRRTLATVFYTAASRHSNTDGEFLTAPTGNLDLEWGPARDDVPHRMFLTLLTQTLRNFNVLVTVNGTSGSPYTIRTGADENGDGIFNDRPAGVARNSERGAAQWTVNASFAYGIAIGQAPPQTGPAGVGVFVERPPGGAATVTTYTAPPSRFRIALFVNVQNLLNRPNYGGYSGTINSPFFGQPTLASNPRKVDLGVSFQF